MWWNCPERAFRLAYWVRCRNGVPALREVLERRTGSFGLKLSIHPNDAIVFLHALICSLMTLQAAVMIVHNGAMVATVWAESVPSWASASNVAVLSLERDDQVWLLLLSRASHLHGYMYTTFSGFLIFEN